MLTSQNVYQNQCKFWLESPINMIRHYYLSFSIIHSIIIWNVWMPQNEESIFLKKEMRRNGQGNIFQLTLIRIFEILRDRCKKKNRERQLITFVMFEFHEICSPTHFCSIFKSSQPALFLYFLFPMILWIWRISHNRIHRMITFARNFVYPQFHLYKSAEQTFVYLR